MISYKKIILFPLQTIQQFGAIDILVSNAATNPQVGQILDVDEAAFDKVNSSFSRISAS